MTPPTYTITSDTITIVVNGETHTVRKGSTNFKPLREAVAREDWATVPNLLTVTQSVEHWATGDFKMSGRQVTYKGEEVPKELVNRILSMAAKGDNPVSLTRFWERLQQNPSWRSVKQLYPFLRHEGIPIDEDGCILAYKSVRRDYRDHHSGEVDNNPGTTHKMARNKISDDPRVACHEGYHVGALSYAQGFGHGGRRIVIVRVGPENVVCVPYDSSEQKMRVCEYTVVGNYGSRLSSTAVTREDIGVPTLEPTPTPTPKPAPKKSESKAERTAVAETRPAKAPEPEATTKSGRKSRAVGVDPSMWAGFDKMDEVDLLAQPLDALRKYATHVLKIVGASKIPGGKRALAARIIEVRR